MKYALLTLALFALSCTSLQKAKRAEKRIEREANKVIKKDRPPRKVRRGKDRLKELTEKFPTLVNEDSVVIASTDSVVIDMRNVIDSAVNTFINDIESLSIDCESCIRLFKENYGKNGGIYHNVPYKLLETNPVGVRDIIRTKYGNINISAKLTSKNGKLIFTMAVDTSLLLIPVVENTIASDNQLDNSRKKGYTEAATRYNSANAICEADKKLWKTRFVGLVSGLSILLLLIIAFFVGKKYLSSITGGLLGKG